jgi:hypothetical protein
MTEQCARVDAAIAQCEAVGLAEPALLIRELATSREDVLAGALKAARRADRTRYDRNTVARQLRAANSLLRDVRSALQSGLPDIAAPDQEAMTTMELVRSVVQRAQAS